jgi:hypothetical protein
LPPSTTASCPPQSERTATCALRSGCACDAQPLRLACRHYVTIIMRAELSEVRAACAC